MCNYKLYRQSTWNRLGWFGKVVMEKNECADKADIKGYVVEL